MDAVVVAERVAKRFVRGTQHDWMEIVGAAWYGIETRRRSRRQKGVEEYPGQMFLDARSGIIDYLRSTLKLHIPLDPDLPDPVAPVSDCQQLCEFREAYEHLLTQRMTARQRWNMTREGKRWFEDVPQQPRGPRLKEPARVPSGARECSVRTCHRVPEPNRRMCEKCRAYHYERRKAEREACRQSGHCDTPGCYEDVAPRRRKCPTCLRIAADYVAAKRMQRRLAALDQSEAVEVDPTERLG